MSIEHIHLGICGAFIHKILKNSLRETDGPVSSLRAALLISYIQSKNEELSSGVCSIL